MRSYFLKRKLSELLRVCASACLKATKYVFAKRTILFVTNQKIRSITIGPILQCCIIAVLLWIFNFGYQVAQSVEIISAKSDEIKKLQSMNKYLEERYGEINVKLEKVSEYFSAINGDKKNVNSKESEFEYPKDIKDKNLSSHDKHVMNEAKNAIGSIENIEFAAKDRIKLIEDSIALTGLNLKNIPTKKLQEKIHSNQREVSLNESSLATKQGGPFVADVIESESVIDSIVAKSSSSKEDIANFKNSQFANQIDYLIALEKLAEVMPLSRPMKNYYVSSGFGSRVDPITNRRAVHQGLDFVGAYKEHIISPSKGRVILAGRFSDYGNAVVIDHGFGITTRYGHLSEVKVHEGQIVNKGDVIASQGNTGRSTGAHLHYEVRYKNAPLNPRRFLEAGDRLYQRKAFDLSA